MKGDAVRGYPVSWEQFHRDARALAWRLGTGAGFEIVVGIARGGLVPATIVARELGLRHVEAISIASYDHTVMGELAVLHGPSEGLRARGARVLVVDDLADTGRTALAVREMLPEAHIAAVYAKPQGRPTLDSFITEVSQDTWIHFPWDLGLAYVEPLAKGPPGGQP